MKGLLAAELLKLRKRLMPRVLLMIMLAILSLLFFALARNGESRTQHDIFIPYGWILGLMYGSLFAQFLAPILAGSWAGNEYGWGTIRMVLSRRPGRDQFVLAGIAVLLIAAALALLCTLILSTIAGWLAAFLMGKSLLVSSAFSVNLLATVAKLFFAAWLILSFYVVLAFSAGTLFRSGAVGIGVGIGLTLADLIAGGIFYALGGPWRHIADHFPDVYTRALPTRIAAEQLSSVVSSQNNTPGIVESLIGLAVYTIIPLVVALALIRYRDVTA